VPEACLARFPVATYVLFASEKKPLVRRVDRIWNPRERPEVDQRPKNTLLKFYGDSFIVMDFFDLQVRCSVKLFHAFN